MSNINILIIEDEIIIAQDIELQLKRLGYDVAGIIPNSEKAIDYLSFNTPDLVLCDITIKGTKDGIEVAEIIQQKKSIPFIFLTSLADKNTLQRAKKVLPYGYIVKPFTKKDLLSAIEIAFYKHSVELEQLAISKPKIDTISNTPLTDTEYQFVLNIIDGMTNAQIAEKHAVSINTVKFHYRNIFSKLDVRNRAEALHKIIQMLTN